jgi:hypothetical protein
MKVAISMAKGDGEYTLKPKGIQQKMNRRN